MEQVQNTQTMDMTTLMQMISSIPADTLAKLAQKMKEDQSKKYDLPFELDKNGRPYKNSEKNLDLIMDLLGYEVRFNLLRKRIEVWETNSGGAKQRSKLDLGGLAVVLADAAEKQRLMMNKNFIFDLLRKKVNSTSQYNPVADFLKENSHRFCQSGSKIDNLEETKKLFKKLVLVNPDEEDYAWKSFTRWLCGAVNIAFNNLEKAVNCQGILILQSDKQGIGKTRFARALCPSPDWFSELGNIDVSSRDGLIKSTSFWIAELGELGQTLDKRSADELKNFITSSIDTVRKPYATDPEDHPRLSTFIGTTNDNEFLKDITGNRRYWVVRIKDIKDFSDVDIHRVWAEIYYAWKSKKLVPYMSMAEIEENEKIVDEVRRESSEEIALRDNYDWESNKELWKFQTYTDIKNKIGIFSINDRKLSSTLQVLGAKKMKKNNKRGWLMPPQFPDVWDNPFTNDQPKLGSNVNL